MVLERTGLVPHVNAGVMSQAEVRALRAVSGSQGLMLESTSPRLMDPGTCAPCLNVVGWGSANDHGAVLSLSTTSPTCSTHRTQL